MKFRYKKYSSTVLRPVIPIEIFYKDKPVKYEVLVDSGADINIFDADIAQVLGIDLTSGEKSTVSGITGAGKPYYIHKVDLRIGGHMFKDIKVGFLKEMGAYGYGVVGQNGFFDLFIVKFDLIKKEIELKPRETKP